MAKQLIRASGLTYCCNWLPETVHKKLNLEMIQASQGAHSGTTQQERCHGLKLFSEREITGFLFPVEAMPSPIRSLACEAGKTGNEQMGSTSDCTTLQKC
ncbi:hypothetical protein BHM03_00020888 [Ensete ventricosum]|nr:hypothetical protein BHM03_00020888 [Ensete ventricosum]